LLLGEHYEQGLLQIKDIVAGNRIPRQYLEQIFNRLVKAGIVRSVRGKHGGYALGQSPDKLTVLQVVEILEGEINGEEDQPGPRDALAELFDRAAADLRALLSLSFADLAARQQELRKNVMFYI